MKGPVGTRTVIPNNYNLFDHANQNQLGSHKNNSFMRPARCTQQSCLSGLVSYEGYDSYFVTRKAYKEQVVHFDVKTLRKGRRVEGNLLHAFPFCPICGNRNQEVPMNDVGARS